MHFKTLCFFKSKINTTHLSSSSHSVAKLEKVLKWTYPVICYLASSNLFSCSKMYFYSILRNYNTLSYITLHCLPLWILHRYNYVTNGSLPVCLPDFARDSPLLNSTVVLSTLVVNIPLGHFQEHFFWNSSSSTFPLPPGRFSPSCTFTSAHSGTPSCGLWTLKTASHPHPTTLLSSKVPVTSFSL